MIQYVPITLQLASFPENYFMFTIMTMYIVNAISEALLLS